MWHSIKFTHQLTEIDGIEQAIDTFQKKYNLPVTEFRCTAADKGFLESVLRFIQLDIPVYADRKEMQYEGYSTVWIGNNA